MTTSENNHPILPKFDVGNIEEWFSSIETIFVKHGVTKEFEQFAFAQAMINGKTLVLAKEVILKAHELNDPYTQLKKLLCNSLVKGKMERIRAALSGETFINSSFCSIWLQKRKKLLEHCKIEDIKKFLFIRAMPDILQKLLDPNESFDKLVEKADLYFQRNGELLE